MKLRITFTWNIWVSNRLMHSYYYEIEEEYEDGNVMTQQVYEELKK